MNARHWCALGVAIGVAAGTGCSRDDDDPAPAPAPTLGGLVSTFGSGGVVTVNPSSRDSGVVAVLTDGTDVWVIGYDEMTASGDFQIRIEKRSASTGALVTGFGSSGVVLSNPSGGDDQPTAAWHDGTDLYVAGYDETAGAGDTQWRIEKYALSNGAAVTGFGTSGVVTANPSTRDDQPQRLVSDGTNLYVVGYDEQPASGDFRWRVEKRSLSTGGLVTGFGTSGVLVVDPTSGGDDQALAAYFDGTDLFVAGYDESNGAGDLQWRIEKRAGGDGSLVTGFGSSGVVVVNPGPGQDAVLRLDADGTDLYAFGAENTMTGIQVRVAKYGLGNGALVTGFGTSGIITSDPTPTGIDLAGGFVVGSTLYVAGTADISASDPHWFVEKRSASTGALDAGFGSGGALHWNPSTGWDELTDGLAIGTTDLIVVGSDSSQGPGNDQWRLERRSR